MRRILILIFLIGVFDLPCQATLYNVLNQLYTGTRNDFTGRLGYTFRAEQNANVYALGRPINPSYNNGVLQDSHAVELYDVASKIRLADVTINNNSPKDALGYGYELLSVCVTLSSGREYMILSSETMNDGDHWMDGTYVTNYREDIVSILGAEYMYSTAGNPINAPIYGWGNNAVYLAPTFYTDVQGPVEEFMEEDFTFTSTFDARGPLYARAIYMPSAQNYPLMIVQHGYGGSRNDVMYSARQMARNGYFCVAVDTRGWGGSAGVHDDGGIEIMDIYDAIEKSKQLYSLKIDPNRVSIIGYSNGGGNVFFSVVRFPYTFRASMALFGIPNYGQWIDLVPTFRSSVIAAVGGTPEMVPEKYMVRNAALAAGNLSGTRFHIAYDIEETLCPPIMDEEFVSAVPQPQQNNVFVNISQVGDSDRWLHGYNTTGHLSAIEEIFLSDINNNNPQTPVMPNQGVLTVIGFVVTPKFTCILGNGDDVVATMYFHFESDRAIFEFFPLSSDSNVLGTMTLKPDVFSSDIQVCVNGTEFVTLEQGQMQEITFPIASTIKIRSVICADINADCEISLQDFTILAERWLSSCNIENNFCDGADIDQNGTISLNDLNYMIELWLQ